MKWSKKIRFIFQYTAKSNGSYNFVLCIILKVLLETTEPFIYLIFPALIIDSFAEYSFRETLMLIGFFIGCVAVFRIVRISSQIFCNMVLNRSRMRGSLFIIGRHLYADYEKLENDSFRNRLSELNQNMSAGDYIEDACSFLTGLFTLAGYAYLIFRLNFFLLALVFGIVLFNYLLKSRKKKDDFKYQPVLAEYKRKFEYLFSSMILFDNAKEVRLNRADQILSGKRQSLQNEFRDSHGKFLNRKLLLDTVGELAGFVQMAASYGYVAYEALAGSITIGAFSMYVGAVYKLSDSFGAVMEAGLKLGYHIKYTDKYEECMALAVSRSNSLEQCPLPKEDEGVDMFFFDHVCFTYPETEKEILHDITLKIRKGERLSVVGLNGAGKTTLVKLLCRLYKPTSGHIYYYGTDIFTIKDEEYNSLLATVFQDFKIFAFTFQENIVLNLEPVQERIERAVKAAGLKRRLESLPEGLETSIYKEFDQNGVELSGGEGHKLVFARACYKEAPFLILDEPTADFDAVAELEMYDRFNRIVGGRTALFISHRLASSRFCDKVAVFSQGRIVEYGSHKELVTSGGLYQEMFEKQAEPYRQAKQE